MDEWKKTALREFDAWSGRYDRSVLQQLFFGPSHDALLARLELPPKARLLDVGCGTGRLARRIARSRPDVRIVGLDLSEKMLHRAREGSRGFESQIQWIHGDSESLPLPDESFDAVVCIHSFHHYPRQAAVFSEMRRVLRAGGELAIIDGDRDGWWGWLVFDLVVTTIEGCVHHCSAREFYSLAESAGLEVVAQDRCGWLAPFLITRAIARSSTAALPRAA